MANLVSHLSVIFYQYDDFKLTIDKINHDCWKIVDKSVTIKNYPKVRQLEIVGTNTSDPCYSYGNNDASIKFNIPNIVEQDKCEDQYGD